MAAAAYRERRRHGRRAGEGYGQGIERRRVYSGDPDRRYLWNVQTPQIFERRLYLDALKRAVQEGRDYTDDCQLAEAAGYPVRLVESDYGNIKITTPEDVSVAESLLRRRADMQNGTEAENGYADRTRL